MSDLCNMCGRAVHHNFHTRSSFWCDCACASYELSAQVCLYFIKFSSVVSDFMCVCVSVLVWVCMWAAALTFLLKQQWGSKLSKARLDKDHKNNISNLKWTSWTFVLRELQLKEHFPHFIFLMCCGLWLSKGQSQSFSCFLLLITVVLLFFLDFVPSMRKVKMFNILKYCKCYNLYSHSTVVCCDVALFFLNPSLKLPVLHSLCDIYWFQRWNRADYLNKIGLQKRIFSLNCYS